MLRKPPEQPIFTTVDPALSGYLREVSEYLEEVYSKLRYLDPKDIGLYTGETAPAATLGQDGDLYIRVDGASSGLYQNINGAWVLNS